MPLRTLRGLVHVSSGPRQGGSRFPLEVVSMRDEHARWWQDSVQPYIDASEEARADQRWRWRRILGAVKLGGSIVGQTPSAFMIGLKRADHEFWPCVMMAMVESYPYLPDPAQRSVFLWYISPAPELFFLQAARFEASEVPKALMAIGMDVAITQSYNAQQHGRLGLHADKRGGPRLVEWYAAPDRGGMHQLEATLPLPGVRALLGNDGRYFYHDETSACRVSSRMDAFRGGGA